MSQSYQAWCEAAAAGPTYTPISETRLAEIWQWSQVHGPANSWTGTAGVAAVAIRELMRERLMLLRALSELDAETREELGGEG